VARRLDISGEIVHKSDGTFASKESDARDSRPRSFSSDPIDLLFDYQILPAHPDIFATATSSSIKGPSTIPRFTRHPYSLANCPYSNHLM